MKKMACLMMALAMVLSVGSLMNSARAAMYGDNIISDPSFEDMSAWEPLVNSAAPSYSWSWPDGFGGVSQSDEKILTSTYALRLARSGYITVGVGQTVSVVRNRTYSYSMNAARGNGYINPNRFYFDGISKNCSSPSSDGSWRNYSGTVALTGSGQDTAYLEIASNVDSGEYVYWDDIVIQREIAMPVVDSDDAGQVDAGVAASFSLFNTGGVSGDYNVFFDPDVTVAATNATGVSYTWVSDTQIDVTLTALAAGAIDLTLTNPYGQAQTSYAMTAVPEPMTIALLGLGGMLSLRRRR